MDNSIGSILFIIIAAVVSLVKYLNEKQQEEKRRAEPKTRPQDLPEATRRMLYGDTQVPTARERQAPEPPVVIVARPRQTAGQNEEGPRPVPPPVIPPPPPRPLERPVPLPIPPRPMQPSRPVLSQPRAARPRPMPTPDAARNIMTGTARPTEAAAAEAREEEDGGWMLRDHLERRRQAERTQTRATAAANTARRNRLFAAGTDLRRAILMNEILGPPVAMRDPFGPFQSGPSL